MNDDLQQLLIRQLNQDVDGAALWIADENLSALELRAVRPNQGLSAITNRFDVAQNLQQANIPVLLNDFDFSAWPSGTFACIIYRVSKERALVNHCINHAFSLLAEGGSLLLLGGKQDGIKTNAQNAGKVFGSKAHIKKHGVHYVATLKKSAPQQDAEHHAATLLDSNNYSELRLCSSGPLEFFSKPGIFGWSKVDRGSALLIEQLRLSTGGIAVGRDAERPRVLDMGCGYGYLLLASRDMHFASRTATDNNAAAVAAAAANFARYHLEVDVTLDDCGSQLKPAYDLILCNPPFHQGFSQIGELSDRFLQQMARLLDPKGRALLVVNQFIPLERVAADYFSQVETLASDNSFKVVSLQQPRRRKGARAGHL